MSKEGRVITRLQIKRTVTNGVKSYSTQIGDILLYGSEIGSVIWFARKITKEHSDAMRRNKHGQNNGPLQI